MQLPATLAELLSNALLELDQVKPLFPTYAHLLVSALFSIYTGTHASLTRPSSAAKASKDHKDAGVCCDDDNDEEEGEETLQRMEGLEPSDAIMFPIMSGLTLAGLYFLIKFLEDPAILNTILSWYFSHAGLFFAITFLKDAFAVFRSFVFPSKYTMNGTLWKVDQENRTVTPVSQEDTSSLQPRNTPIPGILGAIPLPGKIVSGLWCTRKIVYRKATLHGRVRSILDFKTRFTILDVASVIVAIAALGVFTLGTKTWWMTNFLGFCFCYGALQYMSPTTFWTGTLILSSLFFYDIYFVFFTPMMVTVAQKLDVPIKMLFPRPPAEGQDPDLASLAMLGLGDIVVPGMMIGLALRFDLYLYYLRLKSTSTGDAGKAQYMKATGGWGERFWTDMSSARNVSEKDSAYSSAKSFPKTYFRQSILGYICGMVATLVAMQVSSSPQPALLYLVPGVLGFIWMTAFLKGDARTMWNFSDDTGDAEDAEDKKTSDPEASDSGKTSRGLFSRAFLGETKSDSGRSSSKDKAESQDKESRKPENTDKDKLTSPTSLDIVSFSISLPQKPRSDETKEQGHSTQTSVAQEAQDNSQESTSGSSSPVFVEREPRPTKRRKGNRRAEVIDDFTE